MQSIVAAISFSLRAPADPHRLLDAGHAGARQAERHLRRRRPGGRRAAGASSRSPRYCAARPCPTTPPSPGSSRSRCHDVRTPLATVHGFAKTLERTIELEPPADRYVEMIGAGVGADGRAARRALARRADRGAAATSPVLREADTLELAQAARGAARRGSRARQRRGRDDLDRRRGGRPRRLGARPGGAPARRARRGRASSCAAAEIDVSPVTPASAPVVLGEELRDLGAAVAVRAIERSAAPSRVDGEHADDPARA